MNNTLNAQNTLLELPNGRLTQALDAWSAHWTPRIAYLDAWRGVWTPTASLWTPDNTMFDAWYLFLQTKFFLLTNFLLCLECEWCIFLQSFMSYL